MGRRSISTKDDFEQGPPRRLRGPLTTHNPNMRRNCSLLLFSGVMAFVPLAFGTDRIVTTTTPTGPGSFAAAIAALADGDTIKFAIPGAGPHYILTPPDGYPLITNNNITIDGYSQTGASPNTASIRAANNAVLKIVLSSTNGNALSMYSACSNAWGGPIPRLGYGDSEQAILGFFQATNALIKGLVFQANPFTATSQSPADPVDPPLCKAICFAANSIENGGGMCQNFRVSGCWFGIDPVTKQVARCEDPLYGYGNLVASPGICVASYRTRNAVNPEMPHWNYPGTVGVAAGSADPRADFNIFVCGYGFDAEGINYRFAGNFWGVLPDGVTSADMGVLSPIQQSDGYIEVGRNDSNLIIGTDGDGVNDDQEGNIFGPLTVGGHCLNIYSDPQTNIVVAGNNFGLDVNGNPFTNSSGQVIYHSLALIDQLRSQSSIRFGSDFNGVSDDLEGNRVFKSTLFTYASTSASNGRWISVRGNSLVECTSPSVTRPPIGDGQSATEGWYIYTNFIDSSGVFGTLDFIPIIGAGTTATSLKGTCGKPLAGPYAKAVIDLYEADATVTAPPQGKTWIARFEDNSTADSDPAVGAFTFSTAGLGLAAGKLLTIAVTYSRDTGPILGPISRSGTQTTLSVTSSSSPGPTANFGIQKASLVTGPYAYAATAVGGSATFTDNNPSSFYRATGPTATGMTSPFSDIFTIP